eukprot:scaffold19236_cov24-Tisochrysis_lutea.AAC.3
MPEPITRVEKASKRRVGEAHGEWSAVMALENGEQAQAHRSRVEPKRHYVGLREPRMSHLGRVEKVVDAHPPFSRWRGARRDCCVFGLVEIIYTKPHLVGVPFNPLNPSTRRKICGGGERLRQATRFGVDHSAREHLAVVSAVAPQSSLKAAGA